jgi:cell division protease FtsH
VKKLDPRLRQIIIAFLVFVALLIFFGPREGVSPNEPKIIYSELSYGDFIRYLETQRINKINIFIDYTILARQFKNPKILYLTQLRPEHKDAFEELLLKKNGNKIIFTRNPKDLDLNRLLNDNSAGDIGRGNSDVRFLASATHYIKPINFMRMIDDGTFDEVLVLYKNQIDVTISGEAFKNIRYRVNLPEVSGNIEDPIQNILKDEKLRSEVITLDIYFPGFPWWTVGLFLLFAVGAYWIWKWFSRNRSGTVFQSGSSMPDKPSGSGDDTVPINPLAHPINTEDSKITFNDIGGQEEAVEDAKEIVAFLKDPEKFTRIGAKIPRGALLIGPPGTGKTLLGRAIAGESGVPFIYVSGSEFIELYVGVGASRIRDLFRKARNVASRHPTKYAIIFIDEIDAVGSRRTDADSGASKEHNQTLNQLLTEIDGFVPNSNVFVIGATNRIDMLDPALVRRLTRKIYMGLPDRKGREAILKIHMRGRKFDPSVTPQEFAKRTPLGFSGDDLANAVNEAAISAARAGRSYITWADVQEGVARTMMGAARKSRVLSQKEKVMVAYHEAGHHYVRWFLHRVDPAHTDPPGSLTIIGRGMALGYSSALEEEERFLWDERYLRNQLTIAVAGRVSEEVFFDTRTSGASDDFERATDIAIKMITKWIMGEREGLPTLTLGRRGSGQSPFSGKYREFSDETAKIVDERAGELVEEAMKAARFIIENGKEEVSRLAEALIEKETIEPEELEAIIFGVSFSAEQKTSIIEERFMRIKEVAKWLSKPIVWPVSQIVGIVRQAINEVKK